MGDHVRILALVGIALLSVVASASGAPLEQLEARIDSLEVRRLELEEELDRVEDLIEELRLELALLEASLVPGSIKTTVKSHRANMFLQPDRSSTKLARLESGDQVSLLELTDGPALEGIYWKVVHDSITGYINSKWLTRTPAMAALGRERVDDEREAAKAAQLAELRAQAESIPLQGARLVMLSAYSSLSTAMTYLDACQAIGFWGTEISRTAVGGYTTVMYSWSNPDGSNMNAMFQNGELVSRAQFGLR